MFCSLTQLIYDATEEDESDLDADSQRSVSQEDSRSSLRKHAISVVWSGQSHGRDSGEQDNDLSARSMENDSRHKSDSHEAEGDSSKSGVRGDSHPSVESRERGDRPSAELSDDISNQTLESAEDSQDRHSIENNEVTL